MGKKETRNRRRLLSSSLVILGPKYAVMSGKTHAPPDLKKLMDKRLSVTLNANRHVVGVLRGFDQFMNLVLDQCLEVKGATERIDVGMVVVRGSSVVAIEALEKATD